MSENIINEKIMKIINEWESSDKSELIEDFLIMLGEDEQFDILFKLENKIPMLCGD